MTAYISLHKDTWQMAFGLYFNWAGFSNTKRKKERRKRERKGVGGR